MTLFGSRWLDLSLDERNEIVQSMLDTEEPEAVRRKAVEEWGLDNQQAEAIANIALPAGYMNLSEKAIRKLLPHLERGRVYSDGRHRRRVSAPLGLPQRRGSRAAAVLRKGAGA